MGYIDWEEFERNQAQLATNAYGRRDGAKSGRGGRALLGGLLVCRRCGRRLGVVYTGRSNSPVYRCDRGNTALGVPRCMMFGGAAAQGVAEAANARAVAAVQAEKAIRKADADRRARGLFAVSGRRGVGSSGRGACSACRNVPTPATLTLDGKRGYAIAGSAVLSSREVPSPTPIGRGFAMKCAHNSPG